MASKFGVSATGLIMFGTIACGSAFAQDSKAAPGKSKANAVPLWSVNCSGKEKLTCKAIYTILLRKPRKLLLRASLNKTKGGSAAMLVQAPLGPFLPAGLSVDFGAGKITKHAFQTCDGNGCYAGVPLTAENINTMQTSKAMKVSFQNLKRKPITVSVPLNGFAAAYKKLGN